MSLKVDINNEYNVFNEVMSKYGPDNPFPIGPSYYDGDHTKDGVQYPDHFERECPLCFENICVTSTDTRTLAVWGHCGHVFHRGCLKDWWGGHGHRTLAKPGEDLTPH